MRCMRVDESAAALRRASSLSPDSPSARTPCSATCCAPKVDSTKPSPNIAPHSRGSRMPVWRGGAWPTSRRNEIRATTTSNACARPCASVGKRRRSRRHGIRAGESSRRTRALMPIRWPRSHAANALRAQTRALGRSGAFGTESTRSSARSRHRRQARPTAIGREVDFHRQHAALRLYADRADSCDAFAWSTAPANCPTCLSC